jgi:hypothetical protein
MPRDLKLNALPRYSKTSPKFILEEHGHCEVPAGCGGVVLRWRNPQAGIPATIWLKVFGTGHELFIDGIKPESGLHTLSWGRHLVSLAISGLDPAQPAFLFSALDKKSATVHLNTRGGPANPGSLSVLSMSDGSWKYTRTEPSGTDWLSLDYDDSAWLPMVAKELRQDEKNPDYRVKDLLGKGAVPLGISEVSGQIWIRKVFTITEGSI